MVAIFFLYKKQKTASIKCGKSRFTSFISFISDFMTFKLGFSGHVCYMYNRLFICQPPENYLKH